MRSLKIWQVGVMNVSCTNMFTPNNVVQGKTIHTKHLYQLLQLINSYIKFSS